jgi:putative acetyltransferase
MARYSVAEREAWAGALPRDASAWAARQALYTTLVATCDGRCVGFLELDIPRGRIETLYVWPSLARRGIGATLLIHAERLLCEHGIARSPSRRAWCWPRHCPRGWREVGEEWVERGGERLCRKRFEKALALLET